MPKTVIFTTFLFTNDDPSKDQASGSVNYDVPRTEQVSGPRRVRSVGRHM